MHRRRRRQRDLRRRLGDAAQEFELVERQRLFALQLAFRVGRRECHLVAVVVAEVEHRGLDRKAVDPLDEPAPIRAAAELAVGHDLQAHVLLHADDVADALVLDLGKARIVEFPGMMVAERLTQGRRPQQAADMVGAEWRAAGMCHCGVSC